MSIFEAAALLEIPKKNRPLHSAVAYIGYLNRGLPVRTLDIIVEFVAPQNTAFKYRIVPKATLARKRHSGRLEKVQGEVITRLAQVWVDAIRIWKNPDEARSFLDRPHPLLDDKKPIDLALESEVGAQLVRDVLARLEYSAAA